jgi:hypothetical protein
MLRISIIAAGGWMFASDYLFFAKTVVTCIVHEYSLLITRRSLATHQTVKNMHHHDTVQLLAYMSYMPDEIQQLCVYVPAICIL